jgi:hypothetical protein
MTDPHSSCCSRNQQRLQLIARYETSSHEITRQSCCDRSIVKNFSENLTDPVCKAARKGADGKSDRKPHPQTYSYRSISSYWALHTDLPKTEPGRTAACASISFPDTRGSPRDISVRKGVSTCRNLLQRNLYQFSIYDPNQFSRST